MPLPNPPPNLIIPPPIIPGLPQANSLDLSKPPPGFPLQQIDLSKPLVMPHIDMPYYNLPAGLMVPIVKTEDVDYEPIDPKQIKLPVPQPPSEKLQKAVEDFYNFTNLNKPRNP